jgi:hypothetical protein
LNEAQHDVAGLVPAPSMVRAFNRMAVGLTNTHDQRRFVERLIETILWCRDQGYPKTTESVAADVQA